MRLTSKAIFYCSLFTTFLISTCILKGYAQRTPAFYPLPHAAAPLTVSPSYISISDSHIQPDSSGGIMLSVIDDVVAFDTITRRDTSTYSDTILVDNVVGIRDDGILEAFGAKALINTYKHVSAIYTGRSAVFYPHFTGTHFDNQWKILGAPAVVLKRISCIYSFQESGAEVTTFLNFSYTEGYWKQYRKKFSDKTVNIVNNTVGTGKIPPIKRSK